MVYLLMVFGALSTQKSAHIHISVYLQRHDEVDQSCIVK